MSSLRTGPGEKQTKVALRRTAVTLLVLAYLPLAHAQVPSSAGFRDVDLAGYREHLQQLDGIVADCAAQLKLKTSQPGNQDACDPDRVGPNDRLQGAAGATQTREIRYDWLRSALRRASKKGDETASFSFGAHKAPTIKPLDKDALLKDAQQRLQVDIQQVDGPSVVNPDYAGQRKSLNSILAKPEYKGATEPEPRNRVEEWLENLLNRIFMGLAGVGARAPWIGRLLQVLLIGVALTVLAWFLFRLERNARVRLVPDVETVPGAPSAREWQLWLKDAQNAAATGAWREAIHLVYWASISRLESNRLWPADRARTPREYLGLLGGNDPRRTTLTALTRNFERTWYGGREAAADDFNAALHLAAELGVEAK